MSELFDVDYPADANPINRFFNKVLPLVREADDIAAQYAALTADSTEAVNEFLKNTDNKEVKEMQKKRAEYVAAVAKIDEALRALAASAVAESVGAGRTPEDLKREWQDLDVAIRQEARGAEGMFKLMELVDIESVMEKDAKKAKTVRTSNGSPEGDLFVAIMNDRKSLVKGGATDRNKGKAIRERWQEMAGQGDWPEYKENGRVPELVKALYDKEQAEQN